MSRTVPRRQLSWPRSNPAIDSRIATHFGTAALSSATRRAVNPTTLPASTSGPISRLRSASDAGLPQFRGDVLLGELAPVRADRSEHRVELVGQRPGRPLRLPPRGARETTATTASYRKGEQLLGVAQQADQLAAGRGLAVLVEGAVDAIAVNLAGHLGLAAGCIRLTGAHAAQLGDAAAATGGPVLVACDGDRAGREATLRAADLLGGDAQAVRLPDGQDPADVPVSRSLPVPGVCAGRWGWVSRWWTLQLRLQAARRGPLDRVVGPVEQDVRVTGCRTGLRLAVVEARSWGRRALQAG